MSVTRYRRIEDMPRPWRDPEDPDNLRLIGEMLALYRQLRPDARPRPGVYRFRSWEEMQASRER